MAKHQEIAPTDAEFVEAETTETTAGQVTVSQPQAAAPAATQEEQTGPYALIHKALSMNASMETIERLLSMQERIDERAREDEDRQAQRAFFSDLAAAQSKVPLVLKNKQNTHNKSRYADLAAIEVDAMPVIRQHGFSVSAKAIPGAEKGLQRILFRVAHRLGHVDEFEDDFPLDGAGTGGTANKTAIQAKGSTVTYGRRQMLCAYFNIAISDDDGVPQRAHLEPSAPTDLTAKQAAELQALVDDTDTDLALFLKAAKAESIADISPANFEGLRKRLLEKKAKMKAAPTAIAAE